MYVCLRARKVPLALMEEGLVDATVVAGVLSPKGKASPQEEPLFKIKAAAESFRDMRKLIAETLEVREGKESYIVLVRKAFVFADVYTYSRAKLQ